MQNVVSAGPAAVVQVIDDPARLAAVRASGLLDRVPTPSLDRLTRLAAKLVGAPTALVSLLDTDRQVFASHHGLDDPLATTLETPLERSYCKYVVASGAPLLVTDAPADALVCDNPATVEDGVRAYAGFPLRTPDGHVLGSFCVVDTVPRVWTPDELEVLQDLAAAAESEIALRHAHAELLMGAERMRTVLDTTQDAFVSVDATGHVVAWNAAAERLFGWSAVEATGQDLTRMIIPERFRAGHDAGMAKVRASGASTLAGQRLELAAVDREGREFPIEMTLQTTTERGEMFFHAFVHDISDRTAAQQVLEDERTFLQSLLDSLDVSVVACDADGRIVHTNRAMQDLRGPRSGLVEHQDWATSTLLHAPDGSRLMPHQLPLARALSGERVQGEEVVVPSGGRSRRFVANGRSIRTADGRRLGAVVALHDVTVERRSELLRDTQQAVAEALADAASAVEAAEDTVAAVAGAIGWSCGEYWQVDEDATVATRVADWATPGRDVSVFTQAASVLAVGEGFVGHVLRAGTAQWIPDLPTSPHAFTRQASAAAAGLHAAIGLPVRSGDRVLGVLVFCSDVVEEPDTDLLGMLDGVCAHLGRHLERRRAEELTLQLADARRALGRVIDQVNDHVWTVEVGADGTLRTVFASPNGSGVFGTDLPTDADIAATMGERLHPDDLPAYAALHAAALAGQAGEAEGRVLGYDGVTRWVWTRAVPRIEGDRVFIDGISTNITERHELADERERLLVEQQEQVERLREVDRLKDQLTAVVSHELRNPIFVIRGYADILLRSDGLAAPQRTFVAAIDRSSRHLQSLVEDVHDLSRVDSGQLQLDRRPLSLPFLVGDAVEGHTPAAAAKDLTVHLDVSGAPLVDADAVRLRQVVDNLLSNAVKYTPAGGSVHVAVTTEETDGGTAVVTVADSGIGVPEDQLPQLFDRFFRASTALDAGIKGTGLGLSVTQAIVEAHGGTISAARGAAGGTVFTVRLALTEAVEHVA